jgi:hypothetical protein
MFSLTFHQERHDEFEKNQCHAFLWESNLNVQKCAKWKKDNKVYRYLFFLFMRYYLDMIPILHIENICSFDNN